MQYAVLTLIVFFMALSNIFKQRYDKKCHGGVFFFTFVVSLFAMVVFLIVNRDWSYRTELLLPSVGFAMAYVSANLFAVLAIRFGSFAKTSLIISFSLLVPTLYGMIFLKESVGVTKICGLVLLIVSLALTNYEKDKGRISLRWIVFVLLAFIGNGMCSTVQKMEQVAYGDDGKNLFMIVAFAISAIVMLLCSAFVPSERIHISESCKKGWLPAVLCGIATGLTNYLVTWLNFRMPASLMFPVIAAGGIILSFLYAVVLLKEKFGFRQTSGFVIGIVSIVLLNL